jgi:hypothetical protein
MPDSSPSSETGPYRPILNRILHFLGTSPDDDHNRHRLVFFLLVFFCVGIGFELCCDKNPARESLIKTFSSTITWLVGIYVAGAVAAAKLPPADSYAKADTKKTE